MTDETLQFTEKLLGTVASLRGIWDAVGFGDADRGQRIAAVYGHLASLLEQMARSMHSSPVHLFASLASDCFCLFCLQLAEETTMQRELHEKIELRGRDVHKLRIELSLPTFEVLP